MRRSLGQKVTNKEAMYHVNSATTDDILMQICEVWYTERSTGSQVYGMKSYITNNETS
jgi:hypothetical protein